MGSAVSKQISVAIATITRASSNQNLLIIQNSVVLNIKKIKLKNVAKSTCQQWSIFFY